jgi:peptidoglycan/xylan/chitin deacetylase (PgdA/CDA1 family)
MYHHVNADKYSNSPSILEDHLRYIRQHFNIVLPLDVLSEDRTNICMVFDDAGYSFYRYVFPLIRQTGVRVLLSVSPKFIVESSDHVDEKTRLGVPADEMMLGSSYTKAVPFCTWSELSEICESGYVKIASHSYSHHNLLESSEIEYELLFSKEILEKRLGQKIDTFVYPYGQFNASILTHVRKYYRYSFAVGAGDNKTWNGVGGVLFRIAADNLRDPISIFNSSNLQKYRILRFRLYAKKWFMDHKKSS